MLVDTNILLRGLISPWMLSPATRDLLESPEQPVFFSTIAVWEVAINFGLERPGFTVPPDVFRDELLRLGFRELTLTSEHAVAVVALPKLHKDPFDRLMVAQAHVERMTLLTSDTTLSKYAGVLLA